RRDCAVGVVSARAAAPADAARRHRLRVRAGVHHLRHDWREGVALQGRAAVAARRSRRGISAAASGGTGGKGTGQVRGLKPEAESCGKVAVVNRKFSPQPSYFSLRSTSNFWLLTSNLSGMYLC